MLIFVPIHTRKNADIRICVASINLLLSLFGPCLESQCTLCGEPEGEWASPFPNSPCHQHLPPCCFAVRERGGVGCKHSGGDTMLQTHCSSVFIAANGVGRAWGCMEKKIKNTTYIKIASSCPTLSGIQPGADCATGPTNVAPGGSHLYAL